MKNLINLFVVLTISMLILSCENKMETGSSDTAFSIETNIISLSQAQFSSANIQFGNLEEMEIGEYIHANGYFDVPPQNRAQINVIKAGYIKETNLLVGDNVNKGQVVAILENPNYIHIQQSYLEVKGQLDYLKNEYERKKVLEAENITAKKNLLKAEADLLSAQAKYTGLKKELEMMGLSLKKIEAGNLTTTINVRTPIKGTITFNDAALGKFMAENEVLVEVVDVDHLHVELEIFEKDVLKIQKGQLIDIKIPSQDDQIYKGEVYLVGKSISGEQRTVKVHGHLLDEEVNFLPGMYIEADVQVNSKKAQVVPSRAIIKNGDHFYVFVKQESIDDITSFKAVEVKTGIESAGFVELLSPSGFTMKDELVVEGVYYLGAMMQNE